MLRNREIELIAGLVEGILEDETEARALIDRSDEARVEYEAQLLAFETLRSADPVMLRDEDRVMLRREIWTELRRDPSHLGVSKPWFYRLAAPAAAALVLVVGVVAVLNTGTQDGDDGADRLTEAVGGASSDTTSAAALQGFESAGDEADAPAAESDGEADSVEEQAAPLAMAPEEFFATIASLVRATDQSSPWLMQRSLSGDADFTDGTSCIEQAGLSGYQLYGEATNLEGEDRIPVDYLVVVPEGVELGPDTEVTFVAAADCEIAHTES